MSAVKEKKQGMLFSEGCSPKEGKLSCERVQM